MLKKHWKTAAVLFFAFSCVGLCNLVLTEPFIHFVNNNFPNSSVTRANFDRLEVCMKRAEVEAILGFPSDNGQWVGKEGIVTIGFSTSIDGHVRIVNKMWSPKP